MSRATLPGLDRRRLRLLLGAFFLALAIPTGFLVHHAYGQLKWEAFHQHRVLAEELVARIDARLAEIVDREEARSFADYAFLVVEGEQAANFVQRSPLSVLPAGADVPGLVGYFQVDPDGRFSTPLLPRGNGDTAMYGVSASERLERLARQDGIAQVLGDNRLVPSPPTQLAGTVPGDDAPGTASTDADAGAELDAGVAPAAPQALSESQAAFDRLESVPSSAAVQRERRKDALGSVADLKLDSSYSSRLRQETARERDQLATKQPPRRTPRKEVSAVPAPAMAAETLEEEASANVRVSLSTLESDIAPFRLSLLGSGHFLMFRYVDREGQRYVQGVLIDSNALLAGLIEAQFSDTSLFPMSDLTVAFEGDVLATLGRVASDRYVASAGELSGALLYRARLSSPFDPLELILSVRRLPAGPGVKVVGWVAVILTLVLCGGFMLMYRLAARQIDLAAQQQDFVSAVSHELKTPLTSIRMYGEMLRDGWAPEDKRHSYYEYITQESERLSRLVANVLQLARMTRSETRAQLETMTVATLDDGLRSGVSSQVERAGFSLAFDCPPSLAACKVQVDPDFFSQIAINLVDNAIKFSAKAAKKRVEIDWQRHVDGRIRFAVRDHGPGVEKSQLRKIFRLFYRSENELTRETVGTGIGLALVHQLAQAMGAKVDVVNRDPGAEFGVTFARSPARARAAAPLPSRMPTPTEN